MICPRSRHPTPPCVCTPPPRSPLDLRSISLLAAPHSRDALPPRLRRCVRCAAARARAAGARAGLVLPRGAAGRGADLVQLSPPKVHRLRHGHARPVGTRAPASLSPWLRPRRSRGLRFACRRAAWPPGRLTASGRCFRPIPTQAAPSTPSACCSRRCCSTGRAPSAPRRARQARCAAAASSSRSAAARSRTEGRSPPSRRCSRRRRRGPTSRTRQRRRRWRCGAGRSSLPVHRNKFWCDSFSAQGLIVGCRLGSLVTRAGRSKLGRERDNKSSQV